MLRVFITAKSFASIRRVTTKLGRTANELRDRTKPHRKIRNEMAKRWQVNFDQEGGMYGAWPELAEATFYKRQYLGYDVGPILQRDRTLRGSFLSQAKSGDVRINATEWNFVKEPEYLFIHQFGGRSGRGHRTYIPPRPMWGVNADDEQMVHDEMERYIDQVIEKYF